MKYIISFSGLNDCGIPFTRQIRFTNTKSYFKHTIQHNYQDINIYELHVFEQLLVISNECKPLILLKAICLRLPMVLWNRITVLTIYHLIRPISMLAIASRFIFKLDKFSLLLRTFNVVLEIFSHIFEILKLQDKSKIVHRNFN